MTDRPATELLWCTRCGRVLDCPACIPEAAQGAAPHTATDPIAQAKFVLHGLARTTEEAQTVNRTVDGLVARLSSEGAAPRQQWEMPPGTQGAAIMHDLAAPRAEGLDPRDIDADIEYVREALKIGAISYDGDSWYAASDEGGAGLGYDHCDAAIKQGFAALNRLAAILSRPSDEVTP